MPKGLTFSPCKRRWWAFLLDFSLCSINHCNETANNKMFVYLFVLCLPLLMELGWGRKQEVSSSGIPSFLPSPGNVSCNWAGEILAEKKWNSIPWSPFCRLLKAVLTVVVFLSCYWERKNTMVYFPTLKKRRREGTGRYTLLTHRAHRA